jgi:hypothetical protein
MRHIHTQVYTVLSYLFSSLTLLVSNIKPCNIIYNQLNCLTYFKFKLKMIKAILQLFVL